MVRNGDGLGGGVGEEVGRGREVGIYEINKYKHIASLSLLGCKYKWQY